MPSIQPPYSSGTNQNRHHTSPQSAQNTSLPWNLEDSNHVEPTASPCDTTKAELLLDVGSGSRRVGADLKEKQPKHPD
ncbi:hypothetical protein PM082_020894 [Marasmius tenuissimus]|nr:hypothetical protein PM082_020894 [Marasmius tenuissimus]